jgi:hypothetical protein
MAGLGPILIVMAGPVPAMHVFPSRSHPRFLKSWMPAPRAGMTV